MISVTPQADFSNIKLVIYDLDGTLVDAFEDIWLGVNHALRIHRLAELPFDLVKSYVGDGPRMLIRRCLGELHAGQFDPVYQSYRSYYSANPTQKASVYPGTIATLTRLREQGCQQAILTNKPEEVTLQTCENLGLSALVDGIWGERPERPRKPDPQALLLVANHFGVVPEECVLIGDGLPDFQVARAAGAKSILVTYGLQTRQQAETLQPDAVIDAFDELQNILVS